MDKSNNQQAIDSILRGMSKLSRRLNRTQEHLYKSARNSIQELSPKQKLEIYISMSENMTNSMRSVPHLQASMNSTADKLKKRKS